MRNHLHKELFSTILPKQGANLKRIISKPRIQHIHEMKDCSFISRHQSREFAALVETHKLSRQQTTSLGGGVVTNKCRQNLHIQSQSYIEPVSDANVALMRCKSLDTGAAVTHSEEQVIMNDGFFFFMNLISS